MNLKNGIAVALVLAAGVAAAFVTRWEMVRSRAERQMRRQEAAALIPTAVARPAPVTTLTIDGTVLGSAPTSGTVVLRVGNAVSALPVTIAPDYSFVVNDGAQGTDMVSIEVKTPSYRFASLLGGYAKLKRAAGSDGRLTAVELDRVRVSSFSTAMYFFIQRELGRLPVSDAEHEQVIRTLFGNDLTTAAYWLDALAQDPSRLPAGFANGYALLQDQDAYRAFVTQNDSGAQELPSIPIQPSQLGRDTLLLGRIPRNEVVMFNTQVQILSKTSNGWASYAGARINPRFSGSFLPSGEFRLTAQGEPVNYLLADLWRESSQGVVRAVERRQIVSETFRQVFVGDRYSLWVVTTEWIATYPDFPDEEPRQVAMAEMAVASRLDGLLPFREGEVSGERALPVPCKVSSSTPPALPVHLENCENAVQRFYADGTGYVENFGAKVDANGQPVMPSSFIPVRWSATRRGPLELTYTDASSTVSATHWRIDRANEAMDTLVYVARSPNGADTLTVAGLTGMVNGNLPGDFADLNPVGTWRYGSFDTYKPFYAYSQDDPPVDTVFERSADGTTARKDVVYQDAPYQLTIRFGWQLSGGRLYETRYRANVSTGLYDTVGFASCASAYERGATLCAPHQVRYFRPLAKLGNRLYGVQEVYTQVVGSYTPPYAWTRVVMPNYHEKQ